MKNFSEAELKLWMDEKVERYNVPDFVGNDPMSIPSSFSKKQDIEISGFFTAVFAWGLRKTIINKSKELMLRMGNSPYEFILNASDHDLKDLTSFKHRTFQATDLLFFVEFLKHHYHQYDSLEDAFTRNWTEDVDALERGLIEFQEYMFSFDFAPQRSRKHIASPRRKSTCKRLNMMMRWFVRSDDQNVDLGIWKKIRPSQLFIPLDVHVDRVARNMGLIERKQTDWLTVKELTSVCRKLDPSDPGKYDFALFGVGLENKYGYF